MKRQLLEHEEGLSPEIKILSGGGGFPGGKNGKPPPYNEQIFVWLEVPLPKTSNPTRDVLFRERQGRASKIDEGQEKKKNCGLIYSLQPGSAVRSIRKPGPST